MSQIDEEFWQSQRKKLLRNIVGLLLPVDGNVDLLRMNAILNSAPQGSTQARARGLAQFLGALQIPRQSRAARGHKDPRA